MSKGERKPFCCLTHTEISWWKCVERITYSAWGLYSLASCYVWPPWRDFTISEKVFHFCSILQIDLSRWSQALKTGFKGKIFSTLWRFFSKCFPGAFINSDPILIWCFKEKLVFRCQKESRPWKLIGNRSKQNGLLLAYSLFFKFCTLVIRQIEWMISWCWVRERRDSW